MDYRLLFFDFEGRIGRKWYWIGMLLVWVASIVGDVISELIYQAQFTSFTRVEEGELVTRLVVTSPNANTLTIISWGLSIVVFAASLFTSLAMQAKRWHDRGKSGWWSLIGLVPVVGTFWLLIECGFLRGTTGSNRYGSDPQVDPVAALDGNPVPAL